MKKIYLPAFMLLLVTPNFGQDCANGFKFFRSLTLTVPAGESDFSAGTVAISLDTKSLYDSGKMEADGSDLRVTDAACNELDFFIQDIPNREQNVLYVAIPDFSNSYELEIYYGSDLPQDSRIDGEAVFEFFDDFEDGVFDSNKWEIVGHYDLLEETGGLLRFNGGFGNNSIFKYVTPKVGYTDPMTYDFACDKNTSKVYGVCDTADIKRYGFRLSTGASSYDTLDIIAQMSDTMNGGSVLPNVTYPYVRVLKTERNILSVSCFVDNEDLVLTRFQNHSLGDANMDTLRISTYTFAAARPFFSCFGQPIEVEFVGMRKALDFDPDYEYGPEIDLTLLTDFLDLSGVVQVYPNPVSNHLNMVIEGIRPQSYQVLDALGRVVAFGNYTNRIDVSRMAPGIYSLLLKFDNGFGAVKFVKQ